jgi:hypothetical protein
MRRRRTLVVKGGIFEDRMKRGCQEMKLQPETKDILIGLVLMIFGALVILVPNLFEWLVGIGFIVAGIVQLLPISTAKRTESQGFESR